MLGLPCYVTLLRWGLSEPGDRLPTSKLPGLYSPLSISHNTRVTGTRMHTRLFCADGGDSTSGPHACTASALSHEAISVAPTSLTFKEHTGPRASIRQIKLACSPQRSEQRTGMINAEQPRVGAWLRKEVFELGVKQHRQFMRQW